MLRWVRGIGKVVGWLLLGSVGLVLAIAFATQLPPVRGLIRDRVLAAARGSVQGEIELDDVRWPSLDQLELSGLRLRDRQGRRVAQWSLLMVHLRLRSLMAGQLEIRRVQVSDLYVDLADLGDQSGLLSLFASDKPEPPNPDPNAALSPIPIVIRDLCVEHGEVRATPVEGQAFAVERLEGCVQLRVAQGLYLRADGLKARVLHGAQPMAALRPQAELAALTQTEPGAAELMQASLQAQLRLRAGELTFDSSVKARGFSAATLRALGVQSDVLQRGLNLDLHARQAAERLMFRAVIHSAAGQLEAKGALEPQQMLSAQLYSRALEPAKVSRLQLPKLGFVLQAQASMADPKQTELRANLTRGYFDSWPLPIVELQAVQQAGGPTLLQSLRVRYGRASLRGSGKLTPSGALHAQARLTVPKLSEIPPLGAAVAGLRGDVNAQLALERDADDGWDVRLDLRSNRLQASGAQAQQLRLNAHLSGVIARPAVQLDLQVGAATLAEQTFSQLGLTLSGGPRRYQLRASADEDKLNVEGWLDPGLRAWDAGLELRARLPQGVARASIARLHFVPDESLQLSHIVASFDDARLETGGLLDLRGTGSKLQLSAHVPDVAKLAAAFGQSPVPGRLSVHGKLRGALQKPAADLTLHYVNGPLFAGEPSRLRLKLHADAARGRSELDVTARAGRARMDGSVVSRWSRKLTLAQVPRAARHDAALDFQGVSLAALLDPSSPLPSRVVDGLLQGTLHARGNLDDIALDAHVGGRLRASRDRQGADVKLDASYEAAQVKLSLDAGDRRGQLLQLRASTRLALERQLAAPVPPAQLLSDNAWELSTELEERALGELPWLASAGLSEDLAPLRLALHAQLAHAPRAEPQGVLEAQLHWEPQRTLRPVAANSCMERVRGRALLSAKWADQKLGVELSGGAHTNETVQLSARARVPFAQLLAGRFEEFAGVQLAAKLRELKLRDLPWVCRYGDGQLSLDAQARDLLTPQASVHLQLSTEALRWHDSPELAFQLRADTTKRALRVSGDMQTGTGATHFDGQLPIDVHAASSAQILRRRDSMRLALRLQHMPMASLLAFVPAVARVSGTTSGQLQVRGTVEDPDLEGQISLDDVSLTIPRLGQRFSHLQLQAKVDGSTLRLSQGRVKDLDGSASIAALIHFQSMDAWRAEVNLNTRNFPLRKNGLIMGRADANAHIEADMTRQRTSVNVSLNDVAIMLNSNDVGDVQSLEPNPDFSFVDSRASQADTQDEPVAHSGPPTQIHIVSRDGLWVRRDDFAVEMQPDMTVVLAQGKSRLRGEIELLRGYISLLGQSFDIKRGRVVLAGGQTIDPQLDITATHSTPGGSLVRVQVSGFASAPELAFFVDDKAATARDALLAITGGGRGGGGKGTPEQQIAAAALGMTTGLLTLGARREFGDWVPMLAIEQGQNTRVRVGIEADQFIPSFLEGFVRGAYVEGIVSTQSNTDSRSAQTTSTGNAAMASGTGVLIELMLPSHFVWAGQYGPGQAWSIDLDWRP